MITNINKLLKEFKNCWESYDFEQLDELDKQITGYYRRNGLEKTENYACYLYNLSLCHTAADNLKEALKAAKTALEIAGSLKNDKLYAAASTSIGTIYEYLGDKRAGLFWLKKAYDLTDALVKSGELDKESSAEAALNLGSAYFETQDYNNALEYHKTALRLWETEEDDYCDNLNLIGYDLEKLGRFDEASVYLNSALEVLSSIVGENDRDYIANLGYLASVLEKAGDLQKAAAEYEKAIRLLKKAELGDDICCGEIMNKAAKIYSKMGDDPTALKMRNDALVIFEKCTGGKSLFYANCLRDIADIYFRNCIYGKAISYLLQDLDIKKTILSVAEPEYLRDAVFLAKVHLENKRPDKAAEIMEYLLANIDERNPYYKDIILFLAARYAVSDGTGKELYGLYQKYRLINPSVSFDEFLELALIK